MQRGGIGLVWGIHEFCELEMNAHDVRAEGLHFVEVVGEGLPVGIPEIFKEAAGVAVVHTPWVKGLF